MNEVNFEDLQYLQESNELINSLTNYNGVLPIILKPLVNINDYEDNLKKNNTYDSIYQEYYKIRIEYKKSKDKIKYIENEFNNWIKENKEFNDLIYDCLKFEE